MKINLLLLFALSGSFTFSQIALTYDETYEADPQTVIDLSSIPDKGFLGPRVALIERYDNVTIKNPEIGVVVFNAATTEKFDPFTGDIVQDLIPGYYSWNGSRWMSFEAKKTKEYIDNNSISAASLGYYPLGVYGNTPASFIKDGVEAKLNKCVFVPSDVTTSTRASSYCTYDLFKAGTNTLTGIDWDTAFRMTKEIGGYLPVITSAREFEIVRANFFYFDEKSKANYKNAWLGFKNIALPGNAKNYGWITGELSKVDWKSGKHEYYFDDKYPKGKDCAYVMSFPTAPQGGVNVKRLWRDTDCSNTSVDGETFSYLIVEFLK